MFLSSDPSRVLRVITGWVKVERHMEFMGSQGYWVGASPGGVAAHALSSSCRELELPFMLGTAQREGLSLRLPGLGPQVTGWGTCCWRGPRRSPGHTQPSPPCTPPDITISKENQQPQSGTDGWSHEDQGCSPTPHPQDPMGATPASSCSFLPGGSCAL